MNSLWDASTQIQNQPGQINSSQVNGQITSSQAMSQGQFQQPWLNRPMGMMNRPPVFQQQIPQAAPQETKIEENKTGEPVQAATGNMVEVLTNSTNPKHRNSEFLKFLNKLNAGALKIENESLVEDSTKMQEYNAGES